jgi:hypothetical protein
VVQATQPRHFRLKPLNNNKKLSNQFNMMKQINIMEIHLHIHSSIQLYSFIYIHYGNSFIYIHYMEIHLYSSILNQFHNISDLF